MKLSAEELSAKVRRLIEAANNTSFDPFLKEKLAERAFQLSIRAEAIANSTEDPETIEMNIRRYQHMLAGGLSDETHRKFIEEMLADAETLLSNLRTGTYPQRRFRRKPYAHISMLLSRRGQSTREN